MDERRSGPDSTGRASSPEKDSEEHGYGPDGRAQQDRGYQSARCVQIRRVAVLFIESVHSLSDAFGAVLPVGPWSGHPEQIAPVLIFISSNGHAPPHSIGEQPFPESHEIRAGHRCGVMPRQRA